MPAINFQKQFAEVVENGSKRQTIRAIRKNPIKKGDTLYLYTGMRTKSCKKLWTVICQGTNKFTIDVTGRNWKIDGTIILSDRKDKIAKDDGFDNWIRMIKWFRKTHGLPFEGNIIYW